MGKKKNDWVFEDEGSEAVRMRKRIPDRALTEDFDIEEVEEWGREREARGRKLQGKKHRRPRPEADAEF